MGFLRLQRQWGCNAVNTGDLGSIPGLGRYHGGGLGNLLQDSCLENPHGQRRLVGYSPKPCGLQRTRECAQSQAGLCLSFHPLPRRAAVRELGVALESLQGKESSSRLGSRT